MKKIISLILSVMLCMGVSASADDVVSVVLDGKVMSFDVPAQIINDRTMVPMRAIFEKLGAEVNWIADSKIIMAFKDTKIISMMIDKKIVIIQDIQLGNNNKIELDVAPQIVNDRTLVPVRAVAESLDATVNWNSESKTVEISTKK